MLRWSFSGVYKLRDNFKPRFTFQQWNRGYSWNKKLLKKLCDWARCQKAIGGIYSTKKWRAETLQPRLEFDNFKPRLKNNIFKCISWPNGSFLKGFSEILGFSERGVETFLMATMTHLNSPRSISVLTSVVYDTRRVLDKALSPTSTQLGSDGDVLMRPVIDWRLPCWSTIADDCIVQLSWGFPDHGRRSGCGGSAGKTWSGSWLTIQ